MHHSGKECKLLSENGIFIQLLLGALCLSSLLVKKATEKPSRVWKVFIFDTFKQICGQLGVHFINLYLSVSFTKMSHSGKVQADECEMYFITFLIDLFPGLIIIFGLSSCFDAIFTKLKFLGLVSGNYVEDYQGEIFIKHGTYVAQVVIWLFILGFTKGLLFLLQVPLLGILALISSVLLKVLDFSTDFKLFFVMIIFPLFANIIIFWISDNLLKKKVFYDDEEALKTSYFEPDRTTFINDKYLQQNMQLIGGNNIVKKKE